MQTLADLAAVLENERRRQRISYDELSRAAGLTPLSTRRALQAQTAPKVTTLMALADRLVLELLLVPRAVAQGQGAGLHVAEDTPPPAFSAVDKLLGRGGA